MQSKKEAGSIFYSSFVIPNLEEESISMVDSQFQIMLNRIQNQMVDRARSSYHAKALPLTNKKILILDDEPFNLDVLQSIFSTLKLERYPTSVKSFHDPRKALQEVINSLHVDPESGLVESEYCLIISDLNMPLMSGYEFS